jgi:thiol:disulfide interchange protein DsbC
MRKAVMNKLFSRALVGLLAGLLCGSLLAAEPDPRATILKKFPEVSIDDIQPSPVAGIYQIPMGADMAYVSSDGKYLFAGDLFEVDTRANITERSRAGNRTKLLARLDDRDMIVFSPKDVKHTITVFTDVDCGYCRKLHGQIEQLTKLGVRVRYAAYPRSGPGTDDWRKMEAVWCAKDRQVAITQAKLGQVVKGDNCGATPVSKQFELGEDLGVRGTPAIFTRSGDYIGGYLPPADLLKKLEESEGKQKKGS